MGNIEKGVNILKDLVKYGGWIFVVFLALLITASMLKWGDKIGNAVKEVFSHPGKVISFIIITAVMLYFFFKVFLPYFK